MKKRVENLRVTEMDVDLRCNLSHSSVPRTQLFKDKPCAVALPSSDDLGCRQYGAILFMAFIPSEKKLTYREKLQDPRWQKLRLSIFERDNWTCQECGATDKTLHVHHSKYFGNPYDAPESFLKTLCATCHKQQHAPLFADPNAALSPLEIAEKLIVDLCRKIDSGRYGEKAIRTWEQAIAIAQNEVQRITDTTQNTTQPQCQTESYATGQKVTE